MQHTKYSHLSDEELLRSAYNQDPIVGTELEVELAQRYERMVDEPPLPDAWQEAIDSTGIEQAAIPELLKVLDEFFAGDVDTLREKLKRADDFYNIATDAGDVVERIQNLITTTL